MVANIISFSLATLTSNSIIFRDLKPFFFNSYLIIFNI